MGRCKLGRHTFPGCPHYHPHFTTTLPHGLPHFSTHTLAHTICPLPTLLPRCRSSALPRFWTSVMHWTWTGLDDAYGSATSRTQPPLPQWVQPAIHFPLVPFACFCHAAWFTHFRVSPLARPASARRQHLYALSAHATYRTNKHRVCLRSYGTCCYRVCSAFAVRTARTWLPPA